MTKEKLEKEADSWGFRKKYTYGYSYTYTQIRNAYICGAEPREKRVEELEKACEETQELLDKQIEATYRLDKENAELKEKCETLEDMIDEGISYQKAKDYDGVVTSLLEQNQLVTKARGLLRAWFQYCIDTNGKTPLQIETAQFLKESEVEKK